MIDALIQILFLALCCAQIGFNIWVLNALKEKHAQIVNSARLQDMQARGLSVLANSLDELAKESRDHDMVINWLCTGCTTDTNRFRHEVSN